MQNKTQTEVLVESSKNCSCSRIVASPYYGMKILVAAASDRAYTVSQIDLIDINKPGDVVVEVILFFLPV